MINLKIEYYRKYSASEQELKDDYLLRLAIERNLQLAIECALDIGEVIISSENWKNQKTIRE